MIFLLGNVFAEDEVPVEVAAMVHSVSTRGIAFKFLRNRSLSRSCQLGGQVIEAKGIIKLGT